MPTDQASGVLLLEAAPERVTRDRKVQCLTLAVMKCFGQHRVGVEDDLGLLNRPRRCPADSLEPKPNDRFKRQLALH